ncbi:hypothetical protein [Rhizobium viscosum]|uniref:Uncharacterized protein n=1 Tax=Rhizobium viscosum TaxID=1673 RepID=A0ABR9IUM4_RHIVS|nr:hypothetical protein [Rhizobium viscosum]MBE1506899.1 hypothetical protein [Rhizobium viscosum]
MNKAEVFRRVVIGSLVAEPDLATNRVLLISDIQMFDLFEVFYQRRWQICHIRWLEAADGAHLVG